MIVKGKDQKHSGPFRIEYFLCNDFSVYSDQSFGRRNSFDFGSIKFWAGFSNVKVTDQLPDMQFIFSYALGDQSPSNEAKITIRVQNEMLSALVITIPEQDFDTAMYIADSMIAGILDLLCFRHRVPLQIHHIDIYQLQTGEPVAKFTTMPYIGWYPLDGQDILDALRTPKVLVPILRLFREAINSTSPHYRLLCLDRVREGLERLRAANSEKIRANGGIPKRPRRQIPDNELTRTRFPKWVGKSAEAFLDRARVHMRHKIAHLGIDEYERLLLDPSFMKARRQVDVTNAVLLPVMHLMIRDELEIMKTHGLI